MNKLINKQYKFVYIRHERYDRDFDGNDFSHIRDKYPKFVFANKTPNHLYHDGVRANQFMALYLNDYSGEKSMNEAQWTKTILKYTKSELTKLRKELRNAKRSTTTAQYYIKLREMLIDLYASEVKSWTKKDKELLDNGTYTYIELTK